jgi:hypothetical protein
MEAADRGFDVSLMAAFKENQQLLSSLRGDLLTPTTHGGLSNKWSDTTLRANRPEKCVSNYQDYIRHRIEGARIKVNFAIDGRCLVRCPKELVDYCNLQRASGSSEEDITTNLRSRIMTKKQIEAISERRRLFSHKNHNRFWKRAKTPTEHGRIITALHHHYGGETLKDLPPITFTGEKETIIAGELTLADLQFLSIFLEFRQETSIMKELKELIQPEIIRCIGFERRRQRRPPTIGATQRLHYLKLKTEIVLDLNRTVLTVNSNDSGYDSYEHQLLLERAGRTDKPPWRLEVKLRSGPTSEDLIFKIDELESSFDSTNSSLDEIIDYKYMD